MISSIPINSSHLKLFDDSQINPLRTNPEPKPSSEAQKVLDSVNTS